MDIEDICSKFIKKIKKDDLILVAFVFIFGILNYFCLITNNVLSGDGLFNGPIFFSGNWEFDLGRPLLIVLDKLRFGIVNPPIIMFFALLYISISILIIKRTFKIKKLFPMILISLSMILFPVYSEISTCIYCFDYYMLSMLLSVLAVYFIDKRKYIISIILVTISLFIYQAFVSITIVGVMILFIIDVLNNKSDLKKLIFNMLTVFIGLILYFVILKGLFLVFHRTFADYKGASSFGFVSLIKSLPISILNCYKDFYQYFFTDMIIYNKHYFRNIINIIMFVLFFITFIKVLIKLDNKNKSFLLLSIILLPICVNVMDVISGSNITAMTCVSYIFIYILMIIVIYNYLSIKTIKSIFYILIVILSYTYLLSNNSTFMVRNEIHNNFYYKCNELLIKIKNTNGYNEDLPIMINDIFKYESDFLPKSNGFIALQNETFENHVGLKGYSIFYKRYFGEDITMVDKDTYLNIIETDEYKNMKIGDIGIINNVIVAKISDNVIYD